ncbi:5-methylcytosine-specific restriction enzyme subunit McrC [Nakamurella sp. UYEF19]|uniref:McrC family protein n=1 Tax=Nakamurella sp. UYEF19 TaxID=1756392 RepID=UPI00339366AF
MSRSLILVEHLPSEPIELSTFERDALCRMVSGLTVEPTPGATGSYILTGRSMVGVVRVGDFTVELRPKVGIAPVLFLLSYALDPRAWREPTAEIARDVTLAEAIVPMFARTVQEALRPGLLHGYRGHDDSLTTVRGRIRMADQMRNRTGLPLPVEVNYDEFTPDILENRLLRTAVDVLGRLRLRHQGSRRSLGRLRQQLNGVSSLMVDGRGIDEPAWNRLNERYRPAFSLGRLIVLGASLDARAGTEDASAFLIDMNRVFEDFIRVALREHLHIDARAFPTAGSGHRLFLDAGSSVALEPDLSWWIRGGCVFAGDCKYKRTRGSVPNADVYQMLAYLTALNLRDGLLVYAAGEDEKRDIVIESADKIVHVRTVEVARPPREVLAQVGLVAELIRSIAVIRVLA